MKISIRNFLLINLLLAITVTTTLTAIGNYYLDKQDIEEHLDTLMAISALSYQALVAHEPKESSLTLMQENLNQIPKEFVRYYKLTENNKNPEYLNKFNLQIWSPQNELLLSSYNAPKTPLSDTENGFSDKKINEEDWRVFTTTHKKTKTRTVIAERYDTRNQLGHNIALDDFYIMLLTFPLSGLLIWIIIGRGLSSLDKVALELANRAPTHLDPVDLKELPDEIKPVIDELNKLFYRLKEGFEREKRFAADAAHELRTPLAALKAQAQVALHSSNIEEKNIALEKLINSVNRSTHIVHQLLTMSRLVPEAANLHDIHPVSMPKLTRDTLAMLAPSAIEKSIELEFDCEDKKIPNISGNQTALSILIRNIVDNAIRYSKEGGHVLVRLYKLKNQLILEVIDNGPGITLELRERVFERFFRVLGNKSPGSGLGLAIVRQICDLHNGRVELDAPPEGEGLLVRIYLPLT